MYIYIYIYVCVCVCMCLSKQGERVQFSIRKEVSIDDGHIPENVCTNSNSK